LLVYEPFSPFRGYLCRPTSFPRSSERMVSPAFYLASFNSQFSPTTFSFPSDTCVFLPPQLPSLGVLFFRHCQFEPSCWIWSVIPRCVCVCVCVWKLERVCSQTQLCQLRCFNDYNWQLHVSVPTGHLQVVFGKNFLNKVPFYDVGVGSLTLVLQNLHCSMKGAKRMRMFQSMFGIFWSVSVVPKCICVLNRYRYLVNNTTNICCVID